MYVTMSHGGAPNTNDAFWPPKPNEFFKSASPVKALGAVTCSASQAGSIFVRCSVGGHIFFVKHNKEAAISREPAAAIA
jgi:hypothetical protein